MNFPSLKCLPQWEYQQHFVSAVRSSPNLQVGPRWGSHLEHHNSLTSKPTLLLWVSGLNWNQWGSFDRWGLADCFGGGSTTYTLIPIIPMCRDSLTTRSPEGQRSWLGSGWAHLAIKEDYFNPFKNITTYAWSIPSGSQAEDDSWMYKWTQTKKVPHRNAVLHLISANNSPPKNTKTQ